MKSLRHKYTDNMPPLTLEAAKTLQHGDILYSRYALDSRGTPVRWRVSGKPQVWKRSPDKVRVPIKHGLYHSDALTERELDYLSLHSGG